MTYRDVKLASMGNYAHSTQFKKRAFLWFSMKLPRPPLILVTNTLIIPMTGNGLSATVVCF